MEEQTKPLPEEISDNTLVENFTQAKNPITGNIWTIHTNVKYSLFRSMIYELIDQGFVNIKEIELDTFAEYAIKFYNSNFTFPDSTGKMSIQEFTKSINSRKNSI